MSLIKKPAVKIIVVLLVIFSPVILQTIPYLLAAPVRGVPHDTWADIILGKSDYSEIVYNSVVPNRLFLPHGVFIDRRNPLDNKMYVNDSGNSRILGYDLEDCRASVTNPLNCMPALVIGQPGYNTSACNG